MKKRIIVNGEERFLCRKCEGYYPREEMARHNGYAYNVGSYCSECHLSRYRKYNKDARLRAKSRCQPRESEGNYMVVRKSGICKNWFKPAHCRR